LSAASKRIRTATLEIAYEESGAADGIQVLLMHGWPYDPRCYDAVIAPLCSAGARVIVPYLRGFGPTRFLSDKTPRSGQQAAARQRSARTHGRARGRSRGACRL